MLMTRVVFNAMCDLFVTNALTLDKAPAAENKVQFVNQNFVPGPATILADVPNQTTQLVVAEILVDPTSPQIFNDPLTGDRVATFMPVSVAWNFEATGAAPPFTIWGSRLVSNDSLTLYATSINPLQTVISAADQGGKVAEVAFRFPVSMVR